MFECDMFLKNFFFHVVRLEPDKSEVNNSRTLFNCSRDRGVYYDI